MANYKVQAHFHEKGVPIETNLNLISFQEDGNHIVYSAAMDMSGYGKTEQEAIESFKLALEEFVRYTMAKNTIFKELARLGWNVSGKEKKTAHPPSFETLQEKNPEFKHMIESVPHTVIRQPMRIPQYA
ncbi:MAG TPA: hypothetical protein VEW28_05160 [Candidatus Kapabacteria bacterium]|nr:hypothetical protein [Candidatus Kapabacteria bacterium]